MGRIVHGTNLDVARIVALMYGQTLLYRPVKHVMQTAYYGGIQFALHQAL